MGVLAMGSVVAETVVRTDVATLRRRAHDLADHVRWDLRFSEITPLDCAGDRRRFRYATRLGFGLTVAGWGEQIARPDSPASALRFGSDDALAIIREGAGHWAVAETPAGLRFRTVYDYRVRWGAFGRLVDRLAFRPLMAWATRWSFDRFRRWLEDETPPEAAFRAWLTWTIARVALGLAWLIAPDLLPWPLALALALWLLSGRRDRAAAALATAPLLLDPISNLALVACGATIWTLSPLAPRAHLAKGTRR